MFTMTLSRCNQSCCYYYMSVFLIFLFIITIASGDNSVHVRSQSLEFVTSSTLNWLPVNHNNPTKTIVIGGYQTNTNDTSEVNNERAMFVCCASHKAANVAGTQLEGEKLCTVTYLGEVASYERYELLENIENAARLSWLPWEKNHLIPPGAIFIDPIYIARYVTTIDNEDGTTSKKQYIGILDNTNSLGTITYVNDNGEESSVKKGEILVETEPIYYDLRLNKFNTLRKRVNKIEPRIIANATISNTLNKHEKLAAALGYSYKYFSYWGQGHAMIKALNTSITLINGTRLYDNIAWGIEETSNISDTYTVKIDLPPGTAVNVTLRGNYLDYEVPYTGELISHYEDGETRIREISGQHREAKIMDITAEFSPIYFLSNLSIVPTTLPPPTTRGTIGTTTVTTAKTTVLHASSTSGITSTATTASDIKNNEDDENMIIPPRQPDISSSSQNDDGPLSLKNKDHDYNSSSIIKLSIALLLTSLLVNLYRIT